MSTQKTTSTRYSDKALAIFNTIIEEKLKKALQDLARMEKAVKDNAESIDSQGSWMDDTSSQSDLELLQTMVFRQKKHILDIRNALIRVHNKSYGICTITGQLIDERRLMAVPTTTKSIAGKKALVERSSSSPKESM